MIDSLLWNHTDGNPTCSLSNLVFNLFHGLWAVLCCPLVLSRCDLCLSRGCVGAKLPGRE